LFCGVLLTTQTGMRGRVAPLKGIPTFILFIKEEGAPVHGPLLLLLKFKSLRKAGCREVTHSAIFIDGVSLPLSNIEIMITAEGGPLARSLPPCGPLPFRSYN